MLRYLLEKEFKQILRHRFLPRVILFMPLMMLGVLPFAANQEVKEVRVAVLDNDHSTTSRRLRLLPARRPTQELPRGTPRGGGRRD